MRKLASVEMAVRELPTIAFGGRTVQCVVVHHTYDPDHASFSGDSGVRGMIRFWRERQKKEGWAQPPGGHYVIGPDGTIWLPFGDLALPLNANSSLTINHISVAIETVGNFDLGHDVLEGAQKHAVVGLAAGLLARFGNRDSGELHFHRDYTREKTCPGTGVDRSELRGRVEAARPWARSLIASPVV